MQYKYKIVRIIKRAITWFFPEETETIWCITIGQVNAALEEGDKVFKLDSSTGNYEPYTKYDEVNRILDQSIEQYDNYDSMQTPGKWDDHWDYKNDYTKVLKMITNTKWD